MIIKLQKPVLIAKLNIPAYDSEDQDLEPLLVLFVDLR